MRAAILGKRISAANFRIRGPTSSRPVAFTGSNLLINLNICGYVIHSKFYNLV